MNTDAATGPDGGIADFLVTCPTLSGLPRAIIDVLAEVVTMREFAPGDPLMEQGADGDCMMIVCAGLVQVGVTGDDGIHRMLAHVGVGTVLGEMALLTKEPRSADVIATQQVTALVVEKADFDELVAGYPDIAVVLTHLVAERLGHTPSDALGDKVLGGYRIKRRLGVGATAVVYAGEDTTNGMRVALKMLSHRIAFDVVAIRRFHRELNIVMRLRHANVARVYGRFEAFATDFMAMEFCDGRNLAEILAANGPLPEADARGIIGQVAAALAHVHTHDVVHKDLKPANVMVNRDGVVKLMDFGIARPPLDMTQDTDVERFFAGTPRYMAPEQFRMIESGPEVDVYALGCLLLEMLTGQPPFLTDNFSELVRLKTAGEAIELSDYRTDISAETASLVLVAMAPKPDDRDIDLNELGAWSRPADPALVTKAMED